MTIKCYADELNNCLLKVKIFILNGLKIFISKNMEIERSARMGSVLVNIGINKDTKVFSELIKQIISSQKDDGGWRNVEESLWCAEMLKRLDYDKDAERACGWLISQKSAYGGWGQNSRDFARIPLTSLLLLFHNNIFKEIDIEWLINAIKEEVISSPDVFLTYKISLPIAALKKHGFDIPKKEELLELLVSQQNEDGGFGPWKNHPIKSDIISSAYAIMALIGEKKYELNLCNCLKWLIDAQLDNGGWPYHYIDHGSCMGALSIHKALNDILNN